MPSVFIKTFGCQMNVRDSEQVLQDFIERGYQIASSEKWADIILINTCSVRAMAEEKAIDKLVSLKTAKKKNPNLVLGIIGCMAQNRGREIAEKYRFVDLVLGTQKFHKVAEIADNLLKNPNRSSSYVDLSKEEAAHNAINKHLTTKAQPIAYVSIMQGCSMHCSFCIVPTTRGEERSRPIDEIFEEVKRLAETSVKEIVLLGQIVNRYGAKEFPWVKGKSPFVQLLEKLSTIEGIKRIRFTSPHPLGFKEDLIAALRDIPQLCEHVHLPVQSGSDKILKAMRRGYSRSKFLSLVDKLRKAIPQLALSTDIIVGYPGETEEDFQQTCSLLNEVRFDNAFIFRYSAREGTTAASLVDQLSEEVKFERNYRLLEIQNKITMEKAQKWVGQVVEILVEGESKKNASRFQGRTRTNHLVIIPKNERWRGEFLPVRIVETTGHTFYGTPLISGVDEALQFDLQQEINPAPIVS
ncbi:tRNA (N6-isopentenyl adenosine(37)-C2)-methylthiotransferase MiaB [Candidatus Methylacidiphilum infernorum]|uniref:tRNA-2-methylthio-N(6)-dimethylallyladenosine synthase n=1 Tax=Candidatus Methylacidiphilum infernorum TaxID=511746 RepID=A0ABX7PU77_9BACT|nr:tRNA (N6-isopentenyl adenosine(37)-C2)-methylthiotransferase MiaB [Candidatus Methylacidiphilum infernorum]QSR86540.1 tRNA (N6-isopentenyl adenosine(37)-C2)-methylthiotransferase MiaB [Candidatus Methylacidiphilum infernorum]